MNDAAENILQIFPYYIDGNFGFTGRRNDCLTKSECKVAGL